MKTERETILARIPPAELETLKLVVAGTSYKEIASKLRISTSGVGRRVSNLNKRLGTRTIAGLTLQAVRLGVVAVEVLP